MNPTTAEVVQILTDEMIAGADPLPLDANATTIIADRFTNSIGNQLGLANDIWDKQGDKVRNAARQVGIIAKALASINNKTSVTRDAVQKASGMVQVECTINFGEGSWCQP